MTKRAWAPADWMDEIAPVTGAAPEAFIRKMDDGSFKLWPLEFVSFPDEGERAWSKRTPEDWPQPSDLMPGDVVKFVWHESYDSFSVTIAEDGSYSISGDVHEDATHFLLDGNIDTLATSVETLVKGDGFIDAPEPGTYDVDAYTWSDDIAFVFEIVDGAGRFVEVGTLQ